MPGSRCSPPMMSIITEHRMCWLSAEVPCNASTSNAFEYTVELLVVYMETVVMALEPLGLVKVERQCFVDIDGGKVAVLRLPRYT